MDAVTFRAKRRTQLVVIGFGLVMLAGAAAVLPRLGGWVALAIGGFAVAAGLSAFVPGAAYIRFAADGLTVKYAFMRVRRVAWPDIAAVTSELVPLIRHRLPSLAVEYTYPSHIIAPWENAAEVQASRPDVRDLTTLTLAGKTYVQREGAIPMLVESDDADASASYEAYA